mmetsp:Transcript_59729/g.175239  ORF Transcript_59729/g.175239 Transcript_59729/m.175239 type:complete len:238 (-) Transcript_59729:8-721(-)
MATLLPGGIDPADAADAEVPLSQLLAQISSVRQSQQQLEAVEQRRPRSPPPPTWDNLAHGPSPEERRVSRASASPPRRIHPPAPRLRVNLRLDGTRPWLCGQHASGKLLGPEAGFLPRRHFNNWDQVRMNAPERCWPGRPLKIVAPAAELYDEIRAGAPSWKPTSWAHKGTESFPLEPPAQAPAQVSSARGASNGRARFPVPHAASAGRASSAGVPLQEFRPGSREMPVPTSRLRRN